MLPIKTTPIELGKRKCPISQGVVFDLKSSDIADFLAESLENRATLGKEDP